MGERRSENGGCNNGNMGGSAGIMLVVMRGGILLLRSPGIVLNLKADTRKPCKRVAKEMRTQMQREDKIRSKEPKAIANIVSRLLKPLSYGCSTKDRF